MNALQEDGSERRSALPRRIALVVLHEDMLHQSFTVAFLNKFGLPARIRPRLVHAKSKGGVQKQFRTEVQELLKQGAETHLFVLMDADGLTFEDNRRLLLSELTEEERTDLERLGRWHLVCPNYELENWCRNIEGSHFDEQRDVKLAYRNNSEAREAARTLADACKRGIIIDGSLPSLMEACGRWQAYVQRHTL